MFTTARCKKINRSGADAFDQRAVSLTEGYVQTCLQLSLRRAATAIVRGDCFAARQVLKEIIADNVDNPEIYNLFGISFERDGDRSKASRFYRVSYYMDPTFKAAADNLDRVCDFNYNRDIDSIAWGIDMREAK